ncbi:MAG: 4Fe-4S binding protein [Deferribacteraceae bacterium]|jgi:ferredoxin|nr:4Fe-4S binding protein [Deferribacteraceae bacterium]
MINTTQALEEYIKNLQFSCVYAEKSFPIKVESNILSSSREAVEYLISSAVVGNKAAGFFRSLPPISNLRDTRGICVFVSLELPLNFSIPIFFCRDAATLLELFPRALKTSQDANTPVQIVLGANALHNYADTNFRIPDLDRLTPYIQSDTFTNEVDRELKNKKLSADYKDLSALLPMEPFGETLVFEDPLLSFPLYLFPLNIKEQRDLFKGLRLINTTNSNKELFHYFLNDLLNMNIRIETEIQARQTETETLLCPGCPFMLFSSYLSFTDYLVFTSIPCAAVEKKLGFSLITLHEYLGINFKRLNRQTVYIGNLSELPAAPIPSGGDYHFIFLKDTDIETTFPIPRLPYKLKQKVDFIFPYTCNNVKRYSRLKVNKKKCRCKDDPTCALKTACPAFAPGEEYVFINEELCTGCRACVPACQYKALS